MGEGAHYVSEGGGEGRLRRRFVGGGGGVAMLFSSSYWDLGEVTAPGLGSLGRIRE